MPNRLTGNAKEVLLKYEKTHTIHKKVCFSFHYQNEKTKFAANIAAYKIKDEKEKMLMTQLIVTLDNANYISLISKAISQLKGVIGVAVKEQTADKTHEAAKENLDPDLKSIMGIASSLKDMNTNSDERLSYIMSK